MNAYFGLDSFVIDDVRPSPRAIHCDVSLNYRPACPACSSQSKLTLHGWTKPFRVHDTPSQGRPTVLDVRRRRWRCEGCTGRPTFSERGPDVHEDWKATRRLVAYVENEVTERPLSHVAKATGLPDTTVRNIALSLSKRLEEHHRFPTPSVLAVDGIKMKDRDYNVFAEACTGLPIGIIETTRVGPARGWISLFNKPNHIDAKAVAILVSDLHQTNVSLAKRPFGHAVHVADKWHVIRRYQVPFGRIISQEIDTLRKHPETDKRSLGKELWDLKPALLAVDPKKRKSRRKRGHPQTEIKFDAFLNVLKNVPRVRRAFWARYELLDFYRCSNEVDAQRRMDLFRRRLAEYQAVKEVGTFLAHLDEHAVAIFNYFRVLRPRGNGFRGPTTNALEQRNSSVRQAWRSGRGIHSLELLRLRVLYEPWHIGTEIVQCSQPRCPTFVGPMAGAGRLQGPPRAGLPLCNLHTK